MKTHFFKRGIAGLLSLVMCLSAFIGLGTTTAFATGEQAEVYLISFPRSGDANLDYSGTWGHSNLHYMNGWYSGESKYTTIRAMHSYDGNICYCIEPGTPQDTGDRYTSKRIICLLLSTCMLLCLAACGENTEQPPGDGKHRYDRKSGWRPFP